jgi:replicative DNA helicase
MSKRTSSLTRPKVEFTTFLEAYEDRVSELEQYIILKSEGKLKPEDLFVPTKLKKWDANGGLTRGVLTVIGGQDGQGKSFIKKHLATSAASCNLHVAMFDFEDPKKKTMDREIASRTGMDSRKLGLAQFENKDLTRIFNTLDEVRVWGSNILYHAGLVGPAEIFAALEEMNPKPSLVLLDYAQALPEDEDNLERTIAAAAWNGNVYAQKYNAAFVIFSQIKPEVTGRGHQVFHMARKRDPEAFDISGFYPGPGTQDLQWSSALGQRARAVGYIVRPGFYEMQLGKPGAIDNRLDIRWVKVTFGVQGIISMGFDGPSGRVFDL